MLLVVFDAAVLALLRAIDPVLRSRGEHLLLVVLPMLNVLTFTLLLRLSGPHSRYCHFWMGFTQFGAAALFFFVVASMAYPSQL